MNPRTIILAALAAFSISTAAEARHIAAAPQYRPAVDVAALPAYPFERQARAASRVHGHKRKAVLASNHAFPDAKPALAVPRTIAGYQAAPAEHPTGPGLITVDVAGGHRITVSEAFAAHVVPLIADLYAHGQRYTQIKCWASRGHGHHVRDSNHWTGDACDFFGQHPPADIVRAHGLRSGRDFADSMHVDNAKNVGGVDYWNSVRHRHYAARRMRVAHR